MNSKVSFVVTTRVPKMCAQVRYHSDVMLHLLAILLLNSQNSSLSSQQLSVRICRKSLTVERSIDLQITSLEYKVTRLACLSSLDSSRAWWSEISLHQLVCFVHARETAGKTGLGLSFGPYPTMHGWTSI